MLNLPRFFGEAAQIIFSRLWQISSNVRSAVQDEQNRCQWQFPLGLGVELRSGFLGVRTGVLVVRTSPILLQAFPLDLPTQARTFAFS